MAAREQRVRLHFLIALTLAMLVFAATRLKQAYERRQLRTEYAQTERELRQYATDALRPERRQLENLALGQPGRISRDAAALLMQARYETWLGSVKTTPAVAGRNERILAGIRQNYTRLLAGQPAVFPTGQPFLRAYYAAVDGTFQPYSICLPRSYDGSRPYPLVITLHGHKDFEPFQCLDAPVYEGAISVQPEGRGATDYMYLGEDDVLTVLDDVCRFCAADKGRVYLTGQSMGATGCWNLAVHYPDLFTGIVAVSGNTDHRAWEQRWGWNAGAPRTHQDLRAFLHASLSPVSYAENLQHCHVAVLHGTGDEVVPVEHARGMADRLRQLGYPFEYLEFLQAGHGNVPASSREYALAKVVGQPPLTTPSSFVYETASARHDRAWWVRVDCLDSPVRFATVRAEAKEGRVEITTDNVSALSVLLSDVPGGATTVRVDGTGLPVAADARPAVLSLERRSGAWRRATPAGLAKRKGLSGPISDVFRDPFLVVYGTAGESDLHKAICRQEAERFAADWSKRYGEPPRLKADGEVTDEDIGSYNLLILGGPALNSIAARVMAGLPVTVGDTVTVGGETYTGQDVGLMACYPNPLSPDRMIALVAGTTPAALYQAYDRTGLWFNWGAYDKYKWFDYGVFDSHTVGPETFLTVGFFDNQWRLDPTGTGPAGGGAAWQRDPAAAASVLSQSFPKLGSAGEGEGSQVSLSDVRPVAIDQYRGAVGFNRSYTGDAIRIANETFDKGLGVRVPSSLTFPVGRQFQSFRATVGLTAGLREEISPARMAAERVVFEVWGDGHLLAASPELSRKPNDRDWCRLEADLSEVAVLTLTARPASSATWLYGGCAWGAPTAIR